MATRIVITRVVDDDELGKQIEPHMRAMAAALLKRAQRLVPKRSFALHDTLAVSTEREVGKVTTTLYAGGINGVDYALHVERGTSKQKAQPYMRPAMLQIKAADLGGVEFKAGGGGKGGGKPKASRRAYTTASGKTVMATEAQIMAWKTAGFKAKS